MDPGLVLSEVIETPESRVVYVSLRSGTVPGGETATATNVATGVSADAPMVDGGLDPIALPAAEGDSIVVETHDRTGAVRSFGGTVSLKYPPVVVRTGPMRGAVDVGLNAIVLVVFSEPVDQGTVSPETIELTLDGERVPADVQPSADGIRAELVPAGLLPSRRYTLVIRKGVRDRDGLNLREEYRTTFTTVDAPFVASLGISAESLRVDMGQPLVVTASLLDSLGNPLPAGGRRATWSAEGDALVVDMGNNSAVVHPRRPGPVTVEAALDGLTGSLTVTAGTLRFASVSSGQDYTCALTAAGHAYCWGTNGSHELGALEAVASTSAPRAAALSGRPDARDPAPQFTAISAAGQYTCGLDSTGTAQCWGVSRQYHLPAWLHFAEIGAGFHRACGREENGRVSCWGMYPQPWGSVTFFGAFHFVEGREIRSISSGVDHSCGLDADGSVLCWGSNDHGQLGDVRAEPMPITLDEDVVIEAMRVTAAEPFRQISAGAKHTCALDGSGRAYCWGEVNGDVRQRLTAVPGGVTFTTLSSGDGFTCGIGRGGRAFCWGRNTHGQLGNGTTTDTVEPTPVASSQDFTSISAGRNHACAIMADGLLYCWGRGAEGALGTGSTTDQPIPALVAYQR